MDNLREQVTKWWKDGASLLAQLLEEQRRAKAASDEIGRDCAKLREDLARQREENTRLLTERSEIVEKIAVSLGTANDALRQLRAGPPAGRVAPATAAGATPAEVPAPAVDPVVTTLAVASGPLPAASPGLARILVVDDDENFRIMLTLHLSGNPAYEVRLAASGEEALTLLGSYQPELVLLDLSMPGIGGMEALRQIKTVYPGLCVIMVTAHEDRSTAREALALGAADYIVKPIGLDHLQAVLNVYLTQHDAPPGASMVAADQGAEVMPMSAPAV